MATLTSSWSGFSTCCTCALANLVMALDTLKTRTRNLRPIADHLPAYSSLHPSSLTHAFADLDNLAFSVFDLNARFTPHFTAAHTHFPSPDPVPFYGVL